MSESATFHSAPEVLGAAPDKERELRCKRGACQNVGTLPHGPKALVVADSLL